MSFKIVSDTCCNLPTSLIKEYDLSLMPLKYYLDGEEYVSPNDGQDDFGDFYRQLREGRVATTSLVDRQTAEPLLRSLLEAGHDLLYLGFSSGLSGSYDNVELIVRDILPDYPGRTVRCIDTLAASAGQGLFIHHVYEKKREGASLEECAEYALSIREHIAHWLTVDDLKFLARGGRISKTSATVGTALAIKPVIHVDDEGHLIVMSKVRGRKKSIAALADQMEELGVAPLDEQTVFISHGDCLDEAQALADLLTARFNLKKKPLVTFIDPVIGAHAGPGTLALFFMGKHR